MKDVTYFSTHNGKSGWIVLVVLVWFLCEFHTRFKDEFQEEVSKMSRVGPIIHGGNQSLGSS